MYLMVSASNRRLSICGNYGGYRLGVIEGAWVIGIIDELKMCERDGKQRPLLIDTKTRYRPTPPSAPQKQNGRYGLEHPSASSRSKTSRPKLVGSKFDLRATLLLVLCFC